MATKMKWYGKEVEGKMDRAILAGITGAAITLEGEIVKNIDAMDIIDTGRYKGSITYRTYSDKDSPQGPAKANDGVQSNPEKYEAYVGTNVEYARYLEYGTKRTRPRPAIRKAIDEQKQKITKAFIVSFARAFR